uniref:Uncharacterized protein n=1 Tax=Bracon brevicornis TaxID=1563983 RepID=A0A6V7IYW8_9HYME
MTTSKAGVNREKRNFHLYFTYETPDDATSFELSSQTNGEQQVQDLTEIVKPAELKPLTPSPVSCCFSIINHSWTDRKKKKEEKVVGKCTPVRRIQTFLRSRLRKNSRQRAGLDTARGRKNRIGPLGTDETIKTDDKDNLETITGSIHEDVATRAPIKLPPLNLPSREDIQDIIPEKTILSLPVVKRNQQLRVRRQSFNRRPRFKMGPHVTQSAQLSPIPESELSKPASPRTPPKLKHFPFPPTSSD